MKLKVTDHPYYCSETNYYVEVPIILEEANMMAGQISKKNGCEAEEGVWQC